jgi:hypothetical protein
VSTTGNGASPGDFFGGLDWAATPAEEDPGPPPSARSERRRISERLAEAAATADTGRTRGMPDSSPWQRSHVVWHRAGIDWSRADLAPPRPSPRATVPPPRTPPGYPAPVAPAAADPAAPAEAAEAEPWVPPKRRRALPALDDLPGGPRTIVAVAVAAVVVIAGAAFVMSGGDGEATRKPANAPAVAAGRLFALDPAAATSGRVHTLDDVAASGSTVVAIGSEQGGVYSRAQFLTSADGGHTWKVGAVRTPDGGDPPQGEYPRLVAGGAGAWAALGGTHDGIVEWTSRDARNWTRRPVSGAFGAGDNVKQLARTTSGFVAVGTTTVKDTTQAVLWTSADGGSWTRLGGDRFAPPSGGTTVGLTQVAAHGDIVVAQGRVRATRTVTKRVKRKNRKVRQTYETEAFWRSPDGGRTWAPVGVPQGQGSSGDVVGLAATRSGFFAAREASRTTGRKQKRKTTEFGAFFGSPDGRNWRPAGTLEAPGYSHLGPVRGTDGGLTVLLPLGGGKTAVMTSGDAKIWHHVGDLASGRTLTGAALTSQGPVVTGRLDDGDAYLTMAGSGDVTLSSIVDAVHPERTVDGIAAAPGRVVAVGSSNGRAAAWTSPDGSAWNRATMPASKEPGTQRLVDAVHGGAGWLAVGGTGSSPLVLTSGDGGSWASAPAGKAFDGGVALSAAASGPAYVVVGSVDGTSAAAWTSPDLKTWMRSGNAGKGDLDGGHDAPKWMSDVTAVPSGFVAVGGQTSGRVSRPALWSSPDGRKWTLSPSAPALPSGTTQGSLTKVVARQNTLVATGVAGAYAFAAVSADGGRTWRPAALPGAVAGTELSAATATPRGFVILGASGSDVLTWTSADGRTWRLSRPHGLGLDGPGVQRLAGVAVAGPDLLAVGFTGDARTDGPTLWRTPTP